jgi:hypothetical protein
MSDDAFREVFRGVLGDPGVELEIDELYETAAGGRTCVPKVLLSSSLGDLKDSVHASAPRTYLAPLHDYFD